VTDKVFWYEAPTPQILISARIGLLDRVQAGIEQFENGSFTLEGVPVVANFFTGPGLAEFVAGLASKQAVLEKRECLAEGHFASFASCAGQKFDHSLARQRFPQHLAVVSHYAITAGRT
jgi:hypothetical protein